MVWTSDDHARRHGGAAKRDRRCDDAATSAEPSDDAGASVDQALWCKKRCMWLCAFTVACTASRRRGGRMELRPRICPCAISRSAKCPRCFSSSFLVLDKTKTAFFSLSRSIHTAALVFPCLLYTPTLNGPRYSFPFNFMAFSQSKHVRVLPPMRHAQSMASRWGTFRSIGLHATAQGQQGNEPVDPER